MTVIRPASWKCSAASTGVCWQRDKVVLMAFPDAEAARAFTESPEYQAISVDRKAGADTLSLLVHGLG